jgi:hypothetical protein
LSTTLYTLLVQLAQSMCANATAAPVVRFIAPPLAPHKTHTGSAAPPSAQGIPA